MAALASVVREGSLGRAARALHRRRLYPGRTHSPLGERIGCALVVRGHPAAIRGLGWPGSTAEHELHAQLPVMNQDGDVRVSLPIAVNADSLATWFAPAVALFASTAPVLMEVAVDDQDYTSEWLRSGKVLAAVTGTAHLSVRLHLSALGRNALWVTSRQLLAHYACSSLARAFPSVLPVACSAVLAAVPLPIALLTPSALDASEALKDYRTTLTIYLTGITLAFGCIVVSGFV